MTLRIGYASGVFDLFHIGHLTLLQRAAAACDHLIVGVAGDDHVREATGRPAAAPFVERAAVVAALRVVDGVVRDDAEDKVPMWRQLLFDVVFAGDDWQGTAKGVRLETAMRARGVQVVYLSSAPAVPMTPLGADQRRGTAAMSRARNASPTRATPRPARR